MLNGNVSLSCTEFLIFQIIMKYSGKTTLTPKSQQSLSFSFMSPPATRNVLSSGANKEVWKIWRKIRKHYFTIRATDVLMKFWSYKKNLFLKNRFEKSIETQRLWQIVPLAQLVWQSNLSPKVHCTVPHDPIKLQCPRGYEEKDSLFYGEIKVHIDSATVSSTIIAIIYKTISEGDNGSKTEGLAIW